MGTIHIHKTHNKSLYFNEINRWSQVKSSETMKYPRIILNRTHLCLSNDNTIQEDNIQTSINHLYDQVILFRTHLKYDPSFCEQGCPLSLHVLLMTTEILHLDLKGIQRDLYFEIRKQRRRFMKITQVYHRWLLLFMFFRYVTSHIFPQSTRLVHMHYMLHQISWRLSFAISKQKPISWILICSPFSSSRIH